MDQNKRPPIPQHILDELQRKQAEGNQPQYPDGKLLPNDDGQVSIAMGVQDGRVAVAFPHPVTWFAMPPAGAREFANQLLGKADLAERVEIPPVAEVKGEQT